MRAKIDPDYTLRDFIMLYCSRTGGNEVWAHTEAFFHWDGAYLYLVPKEEVPDQVVEDLKIDPVL